MLGEPLGVMSYGQPRVDECVVLHFTGEKMALVPTRQDIVRLDDRIEICLVGRRHSMRASGYCNWEQLPQNAPAIVFALSRARSNGREFVPVIGEDGIVTCGLMNLEFLHFQDDWPR